MLEYEQLPGRVPSHVAPVKAHERSAHCAVGGAVVKASTTPPAVLARQQVQARQADLAPLSRPGLPLPLLPAPVALRAVRAAPAKSSIGTAHLRDANQSSDPHGAAKVEQVAGARAATRLARKRA